MILSMAIQCNMHPENEIIACATTTNVVIALLTLLTLAAYEKEISLFIAIECPVLFANVCKPCTIPTTSIQNGITEGFEPYQPVFYG